MRVLVGDPALADSLRPLLQRRGVTLVAPPARSELPDAADRLESARQAFEQLEPEQSRNVLAEWLAAIDEGRLRTSRDALLEGLFFHARVELALDHTEPADTLLARARAVDPEHVLDPARYPPSLRERWDASIAPEPIEVQVAGPDGLRVGIDGGPANEPPATMTPGAHVLCFEAPGHLPRCARTEVTPRLEVELEPDPFGALQHATEIDGAVRRSAARLGAAPMLVGREGSSVWIHDGGDLGRASVESGPDDARRLIAALFATRTPPPPPPRRAWRWVVIGVAAAVAIGGAVGIGVAARPNSNAWEARYVP